MMFDRILVPINGSLLATQALRAAEHLADRWDCELQALALVEAIQIESGIRQIVDRQLASIEKRPKSDIRHVSYGVAEDIAAEFDQVPNTLIVMGTWGRGRSAGLVPNIGEEVLRLIRQPMMVLGADVAIRSDWPTGPMLIATDGSHFGDSILPTAAKMAKAMSVEPRLVTVVDPTTIQSDVSATAEVNTLVGPAGAVESVVGHRVAYDVLHGARPAREIADYARNYQASSIALSTHGRSGVSRLANDSIAMDIVRHAHCPVILHRPGFADDAEIGRKNINTEPKSDTKGDTRSDSKGDTRSDSQGDTQGDMR